MATYTTNLVIELIGTGELAGTWGTTTNQNFQYVFEEAIVGRAGVAFSDANVTLTTTQATTDQTFRNVYLNCTGTNTAQRSLIVPTINKNYIVENNTTGGFAILVTTSGGTGLVVPNGYKAALYVDGTNVVTAFNYFGATTFGSITDSGLTSGRVTYAGTGGLLQDSANLTFNGTTLTAAGFSGPISGVVTSTSITDSGLTSGRVTYAGTGGLLQDSANLTFNGTTLTANTIGAFTLGGTIAGGGNQINNVIIGTTTPLAGAFTTVTASTPIGTASGGTGLGGATPFTSGGVVYASSTSALSSGVGLTFDGTNLKLGTSNGGVIFNNSSALTNSTLNDYEVGTFTPVLAFGGGSTGIVYTNRSGNYTKVGNKVTVSIGIYLSSKGSSTGNATITGLPFTSLNAAFIASSGLIVGSINFLSTTFPLYGVVGGAATSISLQSSVNGNTNLTDTNFSNAMYFSISLTYLASF